MGMLDFCLSVEAEENSALTKTKLVPAEGRLSENISLPRKIVVSLIIISDNDDSENHSGFGQNGTG